MRFRVILSVLVYLLVQVPPLPAKDAKWFEVSSDHFLLFTDTNEMKGRRLVSDFENRIAALSQVFGKVPPRQFPIEIFLFKEEQDFLEALPRVQASQSPQSPQSPPNDDQLKKAAYLLRGPDQIGRAHV